MLLEAEVCVQIKKDFILAGFDFGIKEPFSTNEFIAFISKSYQYHGKQFKRILYTFDITEGQIAEALSDLKNEEALITLAQILVNKAKSKIAFRKQYSRSSLHLSDHINLHNGIQNLDAKGNTQADG